ncbi:AI-2E family transporter, partial [bacterium]|nr:AI-2E family transporter [bacterium]
MNDVPASQLRSGAPASPPEALLAVSISTESGDFLAAADPVLEPARMPLLRFLLKLPLKKISIWGAFVALLYLLRDFFPLIFMTFVLSYIATSLVGKVERRFRHRWMPVTAFFLCVVALVVGFAFLTVPQITAQAKKFSKDISQHRGVNGWLDDLLRKGMGDELYDKALDDFGVTVATGPRGTAEDAMKRTLEKLSTRPPAEWEAILQDFARRTSEADPAREP